MDVLVIGAGYAGLVAAYNLYRKGFSVNLLEASSRVGGRAFECILEGNKRLELGAQYITPAQVLVTKLVKELGMETFQSWCIGDCFFSFNNEIARYQTSAAKCLAEHSGNSNIFLEIESTLDQLAAMFPDVPANTPWECQYAKEWDGMTFHSWLENNLRNEAAKQFFRFMTNQGFSTEPEQISLLQMLWFLKTSHGIPSWALGGGQANRIVGGTQLVARRLGDLLGDRIKFEERVVGIEQDENQVRVFTKKNLYQSRAVIISIPPQLINEIHYAPPLPADLFRAFAAFQSGNAMKVQALYQRPFWRDQGWSGNGIAFNGIPPFTYDNSSPDGSTAVLMGFLTAQQATEWNNKPKEERKIAILQTWAKVFGQEALNPIDYIEMDWMSEPFIRGGYGCHFPPGVWSELGPALGGHQMPNFDRILWASSDLAKDWNGYLEGAIIAGEQAAHEVEEFLLKKE